MRTRNLLISLIAVFAFVACGTQREVASSPDEGPIIQTSFLGVKFGDSRSRVLRVWSRYRPISGNDGVITITNQNFGGNSWHYARVLIQDDLASIVNFEQEFKYEKDANERFESVYRMLRMKYGEMELTKKGDGFSFTDSHKNTVTITVGPGTAKSGRDFWYCDLTYYWGPGTLLHYMQSLEEI